MQQFLLFCLCTLALFVMIDAKSWNGGGYGGSYADESPDDNYGGNDQEGAGEEEESYGGRQNNGGSSNRNGGRNGGGRGGRQGKNYDYDEDEGWSSGRCTGRGCRINNIGNGKRNHNYVTIRTY